MITRRKQYVIAQIVCLWIFVALIIKSDILFGESDELNKSQSSNSNHSESTTAIESLKILINNRNKNQIILNNDISEPLKNDSIVIVVQVHKRLEYLRHLINSLSNVSNISQALLIFSHDFYDDDINKLVQAIKFCRVVQIFYPHSIQLHPSEFPGTDPNDCTRDMNYVMASERNCTNRDSADSFGHYREARFTQIKHHWWWKMNRVFDQLAVTKDMNGVFLFLEEDHFVAPDMMHVLKLLETIASQPTVNSDVLVLGRHDVLFNNSFLFSNRIFYTNKWSSWRHNMGMAFNRKVWSSIKKCSGTFCTYDDYNWDWSLQYISKNCMDMELRVIGLLAPRVFHVGRCGTHTLNQNECDSNGTISSLETSLDMARRHGLLFPNELIAGAEQQPNWIHFNNGGWGDQRDHSLCLNVSKRME